MAQLEFDEQLARKLDAVYRAADVVRRRRLVQEAVAALPGERILDVGCGPGYYVAELAERVGEAGHVSGVDLSAAMLALAKGRCAELPNTDFREGDATALPFDDGVFDAVVSVQVLEYVADVEAALAELHRVLRPGGRVVLWDVDWGTFSVGARDRERCDRVLRVWDQHLVDPSLPRTLAPRMRAAGFREVAMEGHCFATAEFTADAYGVQLVDVVEQFVSTSGHEDDARAWAAEQRELGEAGEFYSALVQLCFTGRRA
ncbi:MAG TPA: methyltransferase domain-containing protein [Thermoleophilaceae bacterium]|jgi:ubiquinone/menaquinone biosynthesis C-methylase UbiE